MASTTSNNGGNNKWGFGGWKTMMDKTMQSSKNLMDKTAQNTKNLVDKTVQASKELDGKIKESSRQLAESTKKNSAKLVESTKQSSARFAELSKRNSERLMAQVKFDQQRRQANDQDDTSASNGTTANNTPNRTSIMLNKTLQQWGLAGKEKEPDIMAETIEEALEQLMLMMDTQEPNIKWELQMTPFLNDDSSNYEHTDLYKSFLYWAREEHATTFVVDLLAKQKEKQQKEKQATTTTTTEEASEDTASETTATTEASSNTEGTADAEPKTEETSPAPAASTTKIVYNVTKAFERLETYVTWMEDHREDLQHLTAESIGPAARAWNIQLHKDMHGRFVWYLDFAKIDMEAIKPNNKNNAPTQNRISLKDSLRLIVFLSHIMVFDPSAQQHGMVFVQSMGKKTMVESMTMLPMDMAKTLDKFTMGTLPVKLKTVYILNGQKWVAIIANVMKAFLAKKMRQRICVVEDMIKGTPVDVETYLFDKLGQDHVPKNFAQLNGTCAQDIVFGQYVTSAETEAAILAAALEGADEEEEEEAKTEGETTETTTAPAVDPFSAEEQMNSLDELLTEGDD